jgi:hypothetical protein
MIWLPLTLASPLPDASYDGLCGRSLLLQSSFSPVTRPYKCLFQERASKPLLRVVPFLRHHSSNLLRRGKDSLSLMPNFLGLLQGEVRVLGILGSSENPPSMRVMRRGPPELARAGADSTAACAATLRRRSSPVRGSRARQRAARPPPPWPHRGPRRARCDCRRGRRA